VEITTVDPFFHPYAIDGKVYIVANETKRCGLDTIVERFQNLVESSLNKKVAARTFNDGLRLGLILLDPQYRQQVTAMLGSRKKRAKSDVPGDYILHFFETIVDDAFNNSDYEATLPADSELEKLDTTELSQWNPNDPKVFQIKRTAEWLSSTWTDYVRPKYKRALEKWNKDTGGGDGEPTCFVDFCASDRWLVLLFLKDLEANFLLANHAGGRMPEHLQLEGGFSEEVSSSEGSVVVHSSKTKKDLSSIAATIKRKESAMLETCNVIKSYYGASLEKEKKKQKKLEIDECSSKLMELDNHFIRLNSSDGLGSLSPETRELYVKTINLQRKTLIHRIHNRMQAEVVSGNNTGSTSNDTGSTSDESDTGV
jgi:hypothetical protein